MTKSLIECAQEIGTEPETFTFIERDLAEAVIDFATALEDIKAHSVEPFISETWTRYVHDVSDTALLKHGVKVGGE